MYNGKEGCLEKHNIKIVRVFHDESVTLNNMDKRLNVELHVLANKFNNTLRESVYAAKYQIIPRLTIVNSARRDNTILITMEYSAVDIKGTIVPSMQVNLLNAEMRYFVELLFMKMLTTNAAEYWILIRKPVFSPDGRVLNTQGEYAEIRVKHDDVPLSELKRQKGKVLSAAKCSKPVEELFTDFPN